MGNNWKVFTEADKNYLLEHYEAMTYKEIGKVLGFKGKRVCREASKLGLTKKLTPLTNTEIAYIKDNYQDYTAQEIADNLGISVYRVRNAVKNLGLRKEQWYTDDQLQYILDNADKMSYREIADHLDVDYHKVQGIAYYRGFKKDVSVGFTDEDDEFIINNFGNMTYVEMSEKLGYTKPQINYRAIQLGCRKRREINHSYFKNIDTPEKAYFLGFIFADGWICCNPNLGNYELGMQLQSGDKYILEKLDDALGGGNKMYHKDPRDMLICGKECHVNHIDGIRIFSKEIVYDLMSHGIDTNKSQKDTYPVVDDNLFFDFLRGYIDGDGCYYVDNNHTYMHITCASIVPLQYFQTKLKLFDVETKIYTEKERKHRLMCINTNEMQKLINAMYKDENCLCLTRKYIRVKHLLSLAA